MPEPQPSSFDPEELPPSPEELEAILAELDFFLNMEEADALPLEEDDGTVEEGGLADE